MANAYDRNDNLVAHIETKEGEELEPFFDRLKDLFQKEEVARMEIFKKRNREV